MKWLSGVFLACILGAPANAQNIDFGKWGKMCSATAQQPASPLAQNIAAVARQEWELFKGHAVDASGRVARFGNTEAEADQNESGKIKDRSEIPWQNVQRYWGNLNGAGGPQAGADDAQGVYYYPKLTDAKTTTLERKSVSLKRLLRLIRDLDIPADAGDPDALREALRESVTRASISDVAWSAAFISSVMEDAGVPKMGFARGASHIGYITDAVNRALADLNGEQGDALYRACDPYTTKARVGDMLCYHREAYTPREGLTLHRALMRDIATGGKPVSLTHCEIVIEVDRERKKIRTIGGNVQNSVTERTLNMNQRGLLSAGHDAKFCESDKPDGRGENSRGRSAACNLNSQPWFVLLQTR
jgi:hypothetical protein